MGIYNTCISDRAEVQLKIGDCGLDVFRVGDVAKDHGTAAYVGYGAVAAFVQDRLMAVEPIQDVVQTHDALIVASIKYSWDLVFDKWGNKLEESSYPFGIKRPSAPQAVNPEA